MLNNLAEGPKKVSRRTKM